MAARRAASSGDSSSNETGMPKRSARPCTASPKVAAPSCSRIHVIASPVAPHPWQ